MRIVKRACLSSIVLAGLMLMNSTATPQQIVTRRLSINKIYSVREIEPQIVEIIVTLDDGSQAALKMNVFTVRNLALQLNRFAL